MATDKTSLGDRMKCYENVTEIYLTKRIPVIVRLDGRAFHTYTKRHYGRGYSEDFQNVMARTMAHIVENIQGCELGYCQSDEISLLLTDYRTIDTEGWFNYNLRKIISISAAMTTEAFDMFAPMPAQFDSRAFSIPQDEVCNYFIWRQKDATRNAIQMLGREYFSQKQLHQLTCDMIQEKVFAEKGVNFNDLSISRKRGICVLSDGSIDVGIPIFTQKREYIERFVYVRQD